MLMVCYLYLKIRGDNYSDTGGGATPLAANNAIDGTPASVTGELTILHVDDFENHHNSHFIYSLEDKVNNRKDNLKFQGEPPQNLATGNIIRVHGKALGKDLVLGASTNEESIETIAVLAASTGQNSTIVLVAGFSNLSVGCPIQDIEDTMFTDPDDKSLADFYQLNSHGQVTFTGDVAGPYTINYRSDDTCNYNAWASAVEAKAEADGIDLSIYNH